MLEERALHIRSFVLVHKPYMERRTWATARRQWPEAECVVTSPRISFDQYFESGIAHREVIELMVGDLQRIRKYPALGFQIEQEIPLNVWSAWERLVAAGYSKYRLG